MLFPGAAATVGRVWVTVGWEMLEKMSVIKYLVWGLRSRTPVVAEAASSGVLAALAW